MSDSGLAASTGTSVTGTTTDQHGNVLINSTTAADGSGGIGPAVRRFLTAGIHNGDFVSTPHSPDGAITTHNVLPYWSSTVNSGTGVEITSVASTSTASGRVIRFTLNSGAAGDDANIEQIVPVNGTACQSFTYAPTGCFLPASGIINAEAYVKGQYLKADGVTTTGTETTATKAFTTAGSATDVPVKPNSGVIPTDAYYVRVRCGIRRATAAITDTAYIDLAEVVAVGSLSSSGLSHFGGTAFPTTPGTDDAFYRTDLDLDFIYDGTRWLSRQLFRCDIQQDLGSTALVATTASVHHEATPQLSSGSDIYLVNLSTTFFVLGGGTALDAANKWVGTFNKRPTGNTDTLVATVNIASGSSAAWRTDVQALNVLLNNGTTHFVFAWTWTKTGTPAGLFYLAELTYRIVAT